jgi:parallel beta-helix repeat protein
LSKRKNFREKLNKKHIVGVVAITVLFMVFNAVLQKNGWENDDLLDQTSFSPLVAEVHSKILIDGNTALDGFCAGNGTSGNYTHPHIIEDYEIDASGSGSGFDIRNTDLYLIIQNCTVINSGPNDAGFEFYNCYNVKIFGCNSSFNHNGFKLESSSNNTLSGNDAWENSENGFCLISSSHNNTILGNNAWYNQFGILLYNDCNNNTISGNNVTDNDSVGIDLYNLCDDNSISGNNISNNEFGIFLYLCKNTILSENDAWNNSANGILSDDSNNTILSGNEAWNNSWHGFALWNSNNTILSGNEAWNNSIDGINLGKVYNTILSENDVWNNFAGGFQLYSSSNNTLTGNNAWNNLLAGFFLWNSNNTNISGNDALNNSGDGIRLEEAHNTNISENDIINNTKNGIFLDEDSSDNKIWLNFISDNVESQALDDGSDNSFDNGSVGNYWGDYLVKYPGASDIDGIWDIPYEISGSGNSQDRYPLVKTPVVEEENSTSGIPGYSPLWIFGFGLMGIVILVQHVQKKYIKLC